MTPAAVLTTIQTLLPRIKAAGVAEPILLEHARANNLAPAQLTKMAQTLNTARSVAWMDHNPEARGASIPLIDTEKLLADYTTPAPKVAATVKSASTPEVVQVKRHVPNFFAQELPVIKRADTEVPENPRELTLAQKNGFAFGNRDAAQRNYETLYGIREDFMEDFAKCASTIKARLLDEPELITTFLCDMSKSASASHARVVADVRQQITGFDSTRHILRACDGEITKYAAQKRFLAEDRTGLGVLVEKAANAIEMIDACNGMLKAAAGGDLYDDQEIRNQFAGSDVREVDTPGGGGMGESGYTSTGLPQPPNARSEQNTNSPEDPNRDKKKGKGGKGGKDDVGILAPIEGPTTSSKGDTIKEIGDIIGSVMSNTPLVGEGAGSVLDQFVGPREGGILPAIMGDGYSKGKRQKKIDDGVQQVATVSNLQRMILTDPILAEAPPEQIVGLFNDLQQSDPTLANDSNRLRFALREALTYGGIPSQSSKTLAEIDKNKAQAASARRQNSESLYS